LLLQAAHRQLLLRQLIALRFLSASHDVAADIDGLKHSKIKCHDVTLYYP
jgi:hypothetical protein